MNLGTMATLVSQRLNEGASGPTYYPKAEIVSALNEAQRFFVLLTLGLEVTLPWTIPAASPSSQNTWFNMLSIFPDWIVPLRITNLAGQKIRPARMDDLGSLDSQWPISVGTPTRYVFRGVDLIGIYKQPARATAVNVTYARGPVDLVNDSDIPEIPEEYHSHLVGYGIYRCRQVEGAAEFEKSLSYFNGFLDGATHYGDYVRSRNLGSRYDIVPFELQKFDRSLLLKLRKDLLPDKKVAND